MIVLGGGGIEPGPATCDLLLSIYVPMKCETGVEEADFEVAIAFGLATRIIVVRARKAVGTTIFFIGNLLSRGKLKKS